MGTLQSSIKCSTRTGFPRHGILEFETIIEGHGFLSIDNGKLIFQRKTHGKDLEFCTDH